MDYFRRGTTFKDSDGFNDMRMIRPINVINKINNSSLILQPSEEVKISGIDITFFKPNIVSLFANIAKRELKSAKDIFNRSLHSKLDQNKNVDFTKDENTLLFDYFERIQISIISIYTAVEAFANIAIPNDYKIEKKNNKNVTEIWNKQNIERWMNTTEKIGEILPLIMGIDSPKKLKIWKNFKTLEEVRNDIIHPKTSVDSKKLDMKFLGKLLTEKIFETVDAGFGIIKYFCQQDKLHAFFPMGFSEILIQRIELDNFDEYFDIVNE